MLWLGFENIDGDMFVLALYFVLQIDALRLTGLVSMRRLGSEHVGGDKVILAMLLVYFMDFLGSTRAATSGFRLLRRRCGSCHLHLLGDCPIPAPGLTAEVTGAATCLWRGALQTYLDSWTPFSTCSFLALLRS